jgi:hypothetical protein
MTSIRPTEPIDLAVDRAAKKIIAELIASEFLSDEAALDRLRSHLSELFAEREDIDRFSVVMRLHDRLAELNPALAERLRDAIGGLLADKT